MASTYNPISTTTFSSNTTSYTFSSIPATYTDLVLVISGNFTADVSGGLTFNNDSGSNYSATRMYGDGTNATSNGSYAATQMAFTTGTGTTRSTFKINIFSYSSSSVYKPVIIEAAMDTISLRSGMWFSTSAINRIDVTANSGQQFVSGTTLTLYGIKAA